MLWYIIYCPRNLPVFSERDKFLSTPATQGWFRLIFFENYYISFGMFLHDMQAKKVNLIQGHHEPAPPAATIPLGRR